MDARRTAPSPVGRKQRGANSAASRATPRVLAVAFSPTARPALRRADGAVRLWDAAFLAVSFRHSRVVGRL